MSINDTPTLIVTAERPSRCADCFGFIQIGDRVTRPNAFDQWRHAACPRTKFDFEPAEVCPSCFTVRANNGACSCA